MGLRTCGHVDVPYPFLEDFTRPHGSQEGSIEGFAHRPLYSRSVTGRKPKSAGRGFRPDKLPFMLSEVFGEEPQFGEFNWVVGVNRDDLSKVPCGWIVQFIGFRMRIGMASEQEGLWCSADRLSVQCVRMECVIVQSGDEDWHFTLAYTLFSIVPCVGRCG